MRHGTEIGRRGNDRQFDWGGSSYADMRVVVVVYCLEILISSVLWSGCHIEDYPRAISYDRHFAIDHIGFFGSTGMSVCGVSPGLSRNDSVPSLRGGSVSYVDAFLKKESLQQSDDNKSGSRIRQPLCERGEVSRINRELAIVFDDLPFGVYVVFGLIGGGIIWCSFIIFETGRLVTGIFAFALGLIILLSTGFAIIGSGPLGWATWIAGD